jgi:hypothetical protein
MTDNSQPEKGSTTELFGWKVFFQKVSLMFADKILLGGFIALLAWGGTLWADRLKAVWSLQEKDKILNARFDACNNLIQRADATLEATAIILQPPKDPKDPLAFDPWTSKMDGYRERLAEMLPDDRGRGGSWGGDASSEVEHLLSALSNLIAARHEHALLIPDELDRSLEGFIRAVEPAIEDELRRIAALKHARQSTVDVQNLPSEAKHARWAEIFRAHRQLVGDLRATLGLDRTLATWWGNP